MGILSHATSTSKHLSLLSEKLSDSFQQFKFVYFWRRERGINHYYFKFDEFAVISGEFKENARKKTIFFFRGSDNYNIYPLIFMNSKAASYA